MHESRRMKRMAKSHKRKKIPSMNLTSLMDVFTILVFFLLTNTASNEALEPPREITLPDSVVEEKPRETVTLMVTAEEILVEARSVIATREVMESEEIVIEAIKEAMIAEMGKAITAQQIARQTASEQQAGGVQEDPATADDGDEEEEQLPPEVNILADRSIPFSLLKKVMSSCTGAGYTKVSLAVIQKASQG